MDLIETIAARRDKLAAQLDAGRAEYARIEALLAELRRQLDGMYGGLQELDALLADDAGSNAKAQRNEDAKEIYLAP